MRCKMYVIETNYDVDTKRVSFEAKCRTVSWAASNFSNRNYADELYSDGDAQLEHASCDSFLLGTLYIHRCDWEPLSDLLAR